MRRKNFNQIYPYTYYLKRKSDGLQYHGVRLHNVKCYRTPEEDFGIYYFTSGKFKKEFKETPSNFVWKFCWTFDTNDEALLYETKLNEKLFKKSTWVNSCGKYIPIESAKTGRKKTYLMKYGVDHNSKIPSVINKRKQTFLTKYGVDNPTKSNKIIEKIKRTNLKRFGVEWSGQNEKLKEKIKLSFIKNYGVDNPLKCEKVKQKMVDTNIKKYGVKYTFQSKDVIDKIHEKRKEMYIKLAKMTDEEFSLYLKSISQHKAVQSQKKSQRIKGIEMVMNNN
jgi:hypothetical protein